MRKFKPIEAIHSRHNRLAERFGVFNGCESCHVGQTRIRGYE